MFAQHTGHLLTSLVQKLSTLQQKEQGHAQGSQNTFLSTIFKKISFFPKIGQKKHLQAAMRTGHWTQCIIYE
jgi:hypothetical protein